MTTAILADVLAFVIAFPGLFTSGTIVRPVCSTASPERMLRRIVSWNLMGSWASNAEAPTITIRDAQNRFLFDSRDSVPAACPGGSPCLSAVFCPGTYYAVIRKPALSTPLGYILTSFTDTRQPRPCPSS